jgi:hypothetical protein
MINPLLTYDAICNWNELKKDLIEQKIDCGVCYSMIYHHESMENILPPLAYQCDKCQSNLICSGCAPKLTTCPFCKRSESKIEPASSFIINEIKKIRFKCQNCDEQNLSAR